MEKRNYSAIIKYLLTLKQIIMEEKKFKMHEVEGAPFYIAEHDGLFTCVMANYKVSNDFVTIEEAKNYINNKPWELLTSVIGIMIENINNLKTK